MNAGLAVAQLVAVLTTLGGVAALIKAGPDRKKLTAEAAKSGADAAKTLSDAAVVLLEPAREQVQFLRAELAAARAEIQQLRAQIAELRNARSFDAQHERLRTTHDD